MLPLYNFLVLVDGLLEVFDGGSDIDGREALVQHVTFYDFVFFNSSFSSAVLLTLNRALLAEVIAKGAYLNQDVFATVRSEIAFVPLLWLLDCFDTLRRQLLVVLGLHVALG